MKANLKTLLAALLSVTALGMGANAYADGRGDRDGWRDGPRHEHRWDDRRHDRGWHEGWRHHKHHHPGYRNVYFYAPPPVVYPGRVIYGPVYRNPGPSVIIDLPPIIIR